jgi:NAD(P)-dependent dehydrogenase (short-subunit alcohol dehydrogenase family)
MPAAPEPGPQVNVMGSAFMVQAAAEQMEGHSLRENCSVVNISSISAHQTQPNRCQVYYGLQDQVYLNIYTFYF